MVRAGASLVLYLYSAPVLLTQHSLARIKNYIDRHTVAPSPPETPPEHDDTYLQQLGDRSSDLDTSGSGGVGAFGSSESGTDTEFEYTTRTYESGDPPPVQPREQPHEQPFDRLPGSYQFSSYNSTQYSSSPLVPGSQVPHQHDERSGSDARRSWGGRGGVEDESRRPSRWDDHTFVDYSNE